MSVYLSQEDQDCIALLPDQPTSIPLCETKLPFVKVLQVPQPLKHSLSLDAVLISQNKVNRYMDDVDVFYPFIADVDLEKGMSEKPKTKIEPTTNVKNAHPFTKTIQRQMSVPMGEKIMQMLMDHSLALPKFSFREKIVSENIGDMPSNRLRKYKRSASFNSRKVVLLFSVMSCLGTMILIMLTLRVRQMADGSHHG
ncbi:Trigger factor like [Heracleum sosnowskyi]|uniref:Trigger factor like n=1 Tax=Heracleum sosnowskyi TaxID=360622 RepID=A0AAD8N0E8_9APIA|nr:Trigger factor like [Heracleum sosnowskyi]